ncbi:DUF4347 domain-containing protein [Planktothrix agardhii 1806]|jgi:hypothetical protein|uniref:DUF4347 domain-containing protein n=2 Tax=Planktothrix agardhii TaxID=1160 RepID=UPI001D09F6A8|nr:DUF4347 domain-containing protein [Planktothrix agardhii]MCB8762162.1 DUF4347 domain-containing protein [Planktothrix agardhii 1813]MCF3569104.1 DUF4347 domain-containing protein [Planktothrix agardhii 1807]MCF3570488.1 DUF4347 domain-containing protein [Planktothrix agardhii 1805]MCF3603329.1 DUF4347 domain-containing protein [Planktothrix agardhii 1804]MCF3615763.1 DUF4347 domain-containing protein [Planktothrix agardhii 1806]
MTPKFQDLDQLIAGVQPNTAVYVLHPQENGIEQITAILQQHAQVKTVHCLLAKNTHAVGMFSDRGKV